MDQPTDEHPAGRLDPELWVDKYGDYLYRFAVSRIKDPEIAEELVQDTFLAALHSRKNFKGRSSEKTWLVAILKHKIIDHFRKKQPEHFREDMDVFSDAAQSIFDETGHWKEPPLKWSANPMKVYEQKEFLDTLYQCLAQLPKRLSETFVLREMEEHSTEEICKLLDITATNCWVMMYRARMQLRRCIELNWIAP